MFHLRKKKRGLMVYIYFIIFKIQNRISLKIFISGGFEYTINTDSLSRFFSDCSFESKCLYNPTPFLQGYRVRIIILFRNYVCDDTICRSSIFEPPATDTLCIGLNCMNEKVK